MTGASEYGKALFMLSEEEGKTESALAEIKAVADILKKNPEYIKLLDTPALPKPGPTVPTLWTLTA